MKRITDKQLVQLIHRRNAEEGDGFISRESFQDFLEGKLVHQDTPGAGEVFDISARVERLIEVGFPRLVGLPSDVYRELWPKQVMLPRASWRNRMTLAIPVDRSMYPRYMIEKTVADIPVSRKIDLDGVTPVGECPTILNSSGRDAHRYVMFVYMTRSRDTIPGGQSDDMVGVTLEEGICLRITAPEVVYNGSLCLPGSRHGDGYMPRLSLYRKGVYPGTIDLCRIGSNLEQDTRGLAYRGVDVIPVD